MPYLEMFIFVFTQLLCFDFCNSLRNDLSIFLGESEHHLRSEYNGTPLLTYENSKLIHRLSKIPFVSSFISEAWYKILEGTSIENVTVDEWKELKPIIPYLPSQFLLRINITCDEMLQLFGGIELRQEQLAMLAEVVLSVWGDDIVNSESHLMKLGNIFCGLPNTHLENIEPNIFRYEFCVCGENGA
ncbi:hypothetical protein RUM43_013230 [Polyplax serrata]|uniref:Uncharacterized protein n=1 Tax=Polyplax serrata TaxID=468196 RepID=A0AAN8NRR0_POLSC